MSRRLYRSRTDTVVGGVAAGLAGYLSTDPALVRIAWAILVPLTGGIAFLVYLVCWVAIPEEPKATPAAIGDDGAVEGLIDGQPALVPDAADGASRSNPTLWVGLGLVALGVWFLVRDYLPEIEIDWNLVWPIIIVAIGVVILVGALRRREG